MRWLTIIVAILGASGLAGCSFSERVEHQIAPDTVSLADRCGAIMQAAMPFAQIELGDRGSRSPDVRTIIATVVGTRADVPKDAANGRDVAAECTFVDGVVTAFRWTKGGPPPPIGSEQPHPPGETSPSPAPAPAGKTKPGH